MTFGPQGNCASWVSENQFAWIRRSRWLYVDLRDLKEDGPYTEPVKLISKWSQQEYINWMTSCGLPTRGYNKLKVSEIRTVIIGHTIDLETCPPILAPWGGPIENINAVIISLTAVISHCLGYTLLFSTKLG